MMAQYYTNDILDILDSYNVKATFFVVGKEGTNAEEALQRIVDEGHTLGMHSYSHKYKELYESMDSFTQDFVRIRDYIYQATGVESVCYRFPGGSSNTVSEIDMHDFIDYLDSQGVEYYDWNVSSGDGGSMKYPRIHYWKTVPRISIPETRLSYCCMIPRRSRLQWKLCRIS